MLKPPKIVMVILISSWTALAFVYYNSNKLYITTKQELPELIYQYTGDEEYLINTTGCFIPNYGRTMKFYEAERSTKTCGHRVIFVSKIPPDKLEVSFRIDKLKSLYKSQPKDCYYTFARRSKEAGKEDTKIIHTKPKYFVNNKTNIIPFGREALRITCTNNKRKVLYEDHYVILKEKLPVRSDNSSQTSKTWNVLVVGVDTMSRARTKYNLPETDKYLQSKGWIDYKGYQKVAFNTFPNVMALLTGKKLSTIYKLCDRMNDCSDMLLWNKFKDSGYITAYGEDYLSLPDTFAGHHGFTIPPTDHYMRPFFLLGEVRVGNRVCSGKKSSTLHLLHYAQDFAISYKNKKNFGFFWINTLAHNLDELPSIYDMNLVEFFKNLENSGVLENTFILFLSDHGIRFGPSRFSMESYFAERLPMLYLWAPVQFRNNYIQLYNNLIMNQHVLTTPYDIYITLQDILNLSNNSASIEQSEACCNCSSLLIKQPLSRSCSDVGVDEKWCSCHKMETPDNNTELQESIKASVNSINDKVKSVKTKECTMCKPLQLRKVVRSHTYRIDDVNYYVIAFIMDPGNYAYETTVKINGTKIKTLSPTHTISPFRSYGDCTINYYDKQYCYCITKEHCKPSKKHK